MLRSLGDGRKSNFQLRGISSIYKFTVKISAEHTAALRLFFSIYIVETRLNRIARHAPAILGTLSKTLTSRFREK